MGRRPATGVPALTGFGTGILAFILLGNCLVFGQGFSAAISGVVRDASGAVIPDATITARNTETALTRTTQTTASGVYSLPSLPVGPYELTVEKIGFRQLMRSGINLSVAQEVVLNLTLEVGEVQQTVEVTGEAPLVNTTLSPTSGLITEGQIKDLPLNGRSFLELMTLNAGVISNRANTSGNSPSYSIAGKRPDMNRFTMNGMDYVGNNATGVYTSPQGLSGSLLGVDAVREFNVLGHTYGAEYGKRSGGQVTIVTTSGTNQLRGTAFEYLRNDKLDTRNFFSQQDRDGDGKADVEPFKRNQFGGSLGGPIIRDKMFVYGNYEGFRERLDLTFDEFVPSAQARQGLLPCNVVHTTAPAREANCPDLNTYIPVPNLQSGILPFFRYWPAPNGEESLVKDAATGRDLATGVAKYNGNAARSVQEDFGLARFDYSISSQDSLSTNFTVDKGSRKNPEDPTFLQDQVTDLYTLSVQETHIFSPTVLNLAMFGFSSARATSENPPAGEPFPENLVLMRGGEKQKNPGSLIIGGGILSVQAAALLAPNGGNFYYNERRNFSGSDDLSVSRGRHNLKMGVWFTRVHQTLFSQGQNNAGTASYPTVLAFLQDAPSLFRSPTTPTELLFRSTQAAWYIQDEIKLRPNLTVRLGLRDEMTTGWNEAKGRAANYLYDQAGVIRTHPNIGHSGLIENNAVALWQPRVGVAWDPTGSGKWAVRAGFGIHNDLQDNLAQRFASNPPFNGRVDFTNRPLLSIVPFQADTPAPSCSAESPLRQPDCLIYAPGGIDPILHTPTVQQWSLTVEREVAQDLMVELSYLGSQSYHIMTQVDMNSVWPLRCENPQGCAAGGVGRGRSVVPQGIEYIPVGTRANPFVGSTMTWMFFGTSSYHAMNLSVLKRARAGLTFKSSYSWGKVLDINSANLAGQAQNAHATILNRFNPKLDKGVAAFSILHQFSTNASYQLPFGQGRRFASGASGWVDKLISGWQWNGIFSAQSGFPLTPIVGFNRSGNGDTRNADVPDRSPNFQGKVVLGDDGFKKTGHYYDPNAFSVPLAGTFGNAGRGVIRGPGLVNVDTSFFKTIPLNERWNLQFRTEVFNLLNHAQFDTPNSVVFTGTTISPSAGAITETASGGNGRIIQFALRLEF